MPAAVWLCKSTVKLKYVSVFNSKPGAGVPGPFQSLDVEALEPTVIGSIKELFAGCAEVARLVAGGVEPPLADHSPTAVEGKVLVDGDVVAFAADFDIFLSHPAPVAVPAYVNLGDMINFVMEMK